MAVVPVFGGWAVYRLVRRVLPATGAGVIGATAIAAGASVVMAAAAFSIEWLLGARDLDAAALSDRRHVGARPFVIGSLLVALCCATVVSQFAADDPDGLERVAEDKGFRRSAERARSVLSVHGHEPGRARRSRARAAGGASEWGQRAARSSS